MRRFVMLMAALALAAGCASVSGSEYRPQYGQYGRSDGVFQRLDSNGFDLFVNGYRGVSLGKPMYEDFTEYGDGDLSCAQSDGTPCSVTDNEVNIFTFPSGNRIACVNESQQDVYGPDMDAAYLDISGDQTAADGMSCQQAWGMESQHTFIVGEDPAFFTCGRFTISDVSDVSELHFGFVDYNDGDAGGVLGLNGTFDNYQDLVSIGPMAGDIKIETIDDDGATTTTDTTNNWADNATHSLCVYVSAAGVVTYTIDNAPPITTAAFTFDDANDSQSSISNAVTPFFYNLLGGDGTATVRMLWWKSGYGTWPTNQ